MGKHLQKNTPGWMNQEAALSFLNTSKRTLGRKVEAGEVRKSLIEGRPCYSIDDINKLIAEKTGSPVVPTATEAPLFSSEGMKKLRGYWRDEPSERGVLLAVEMGARMHALQREIGKTLTASLVRDALAAEEELATRVTIPEQEQESWEAYQRRGQDALFDDGHLDGVKRLVAEGEISGLEAVQRVRAVCEEVKRLRSLRGYVTKLASEAREAEEKHCGEVSILKKVAATLQQQHESVLQAQVDAHNRALEEAATVAAADRGAAVREAQVSADAGKAAAVDRTIQAAQLLGAMEKGAAVKVASREGAERVVAAEARMQLAESESQKCLVTMGEQQEGYDQRILDLRASLEAEHAEVVDAGDERESALQEALDALQADLNRTRVDRDTHRDAGKESFLWRKMLNKMLKRAGLPDADTIGTWLDKYGEEFRQDMLPSLAGDMQRRLLARRGPEENLLVASRTTEAGVSLLDLLSKSTSDDPSDK